MGVEGAVGAAAALGHQGRVGGGGGGGGGWAGSWDGRWYWAAGRDTAGDGDCHRLGAVVGGGRLHQHHTQALGRRLALGRLAVGEEEGEDASLQACPRALPLQVAGQLQSAAVGHGSVGICRAAWGRAGGRW